MTFNFKTMDHEYYMREALKEAEISRKEGERPIGAVIVHENRIIGRGRAQSLARKSNITHAELNAILSAERYLYENTHGDCVIYTTVEPCVMCLGAIVMANIDNVVYGLDDNWIKPREMLAIDYVRRHIKNYAGGVLAEDSAKLWESSEWDELLLLREGKQRGQ
jgi:tRNA(adenine34) deaminase